MTHKTSLDAQQQISLEQKRLTISDHILLMRQNVLHHLSDDFHFDNTDLLDIEFKKYQHTKAAYDKAFGVIAQLTPKELDFLLPQVWEGHSIIQHCLKFAEQKEHEQKRSKLKERLNTAKHILSPLTYFAVLASPHKKQFLSSPKCISQRSESR